MNLSTIYAAAVTHKAAAVQVVTGRPSQAAAGEAAHGRDAAGRDYVRLTIPDDRTAKGRTIRAHEATHANLLVTDRRRKSSAETAAGTSNAIEDIRVHVALHNAGGEAFARDVAATALRDARQLRRADVAALSRVAPDALRALRGAAVRTLAILQLEYGRGRAEAAETVARALWPGMPAGVARNAVRRAVAAVRSRKWRVASDALRPLLMTTAEPVPSRDPGPGTEHDPDADPLDRDPRRLWVNEPTRLLAAGVRVLRPADAGHRLRAGKLVAATLGQCRRPFRRVHHVVGYGTCLVDASGSMRLTTEDLQGLLDYSPSGLVAFWAGWRDRDAVPVPGLQGTQGALTIYARDGRKIAPGDVEAVLAMIGDQCCDYWAMDWLRQQRPPLLLVSDLKFCGGMQGQAEAASAIVGELLAAGRLTVVETCADARHLFNRKGGRP